jgi:hypothetical protein
LRGLAAAVLALGVLVAVVGVLPGCSGAGDNEKPKTPAKEKSGTDKETPKEKPAAKPEEKPAEKPAPKPEEKPEEKPAAKAEPVEIDTSQTAKISSYAPAADLVSQVPEYVEDLKEAVADEATFKDSESVIGRSANTLIVVALALGMHDEDNKYKASAPAMVKAAQDLAAAKDVAAAQKAMEALSALAEGGAGEAVDGELKWGKVASLEQLMKAVPIVRNKMKSSSLSSASRLKKKADDYAGHAAVLAVIAQSAIPYADETDAPTEVEKWQQYCIDMRVASARLHAAIRALDTEAAIEIQKVDLEESCTDCHAVFQPDVE